MIMHYCNFALVQLFIIYYTYESMSKSEIGLRERKRRETRQRLEKEAVELVASVGLEQTTIETISERAQVSPRTFFNYFDSKEDAILGLHSMAITHELVAQHMQQHHYKGLSESIVGFMISLFGPSLSDTSLHIARRKIIRHHPHLLERKVSRMTTMARQLTETIPTLAHNNGYGTITPAEAEVITAVCISAVRVSVREWMMTRKRFSADDLITQSLQIINEVTNKL